LSPFVVNAVITAFLLRFALYCYALSNCYAFCTNCNVSYLLLVWHDVSY